MQAQNQRDYELLHKQLILHSELGDLNQIKNLFENSKLNINYTNAQGYTALALAVKNGHYPIVGYLLILGGDPNKPNKSGQTPVFLSCWFQKTEILKLLLENNSDINKPDQRGWTPLMISCYNGHEQIVSILLSYNADITIKDYFQKTAFDRANNNAIRTLLQSHVDKQGLQQSQEVECSPKQNEIKTSNMAKNHLLNKKYVYNNNNNSAFISSKGANNNTQNSHSNMNKMSPSTHVPQETSVIQMQASQMNGSNAARPIKDKLLDFYSQNDHYSTPNRSHKLPIKSDTKVPCLQHQRSQSASNIFHKQSSQIIPSKSSDKSQLLMKNKQYSKIKHLYNVTYDIQSKIQSQNKFSNTVDSSQVNNGKNNQQKLMQFYDLVNETTPSPSPQKVPQFITNTIRQQKLASDNKQQNKKRGFSNNMITENNIKINTINLQVNNILKTQLTKMTDVIQEMVSGQIIQSAQLIADENAIKFMSSIDEYIEEKCNDFNEQLLHQMELKIEVMLRKAGYYNLNEQQYELELTENDANNKKSFKQSQDQKIIQTKRNEKKISKLLDQQKEVQEQILQRSLKETSFDNNLHAQNAINRQTNEKKLNQQVNIEFEKAMPKQMELHSRSVLQKAALQMRHEVHDKHQVLHKQMQPKLDLILNNYMQKQKQVFDQQLDQLQLNKYKSAQSEKNINGDQSKISKLMDSDVCEVKKHINFEENSFRYLNPILDSNTQDCEQRKQDQNQIVLQNNDDKEAFERMKSEYLNHSNAQNCRQKMAFVHFKQNT